MAGLTATPNFKHASLMLELSRKLREEDLAYLKAFISQLYGRDANSCTTFCNIWEWLQRKGHISVGHYDALSEIFKALEYHQCKQLVDEVQILMQQEEPIRIGNGKTFLRDTILFNRLLDDLQHLMNKDGDPPVVEEFAFANAAAKIYHPNDGIRLTLYNGDEIIIPDQAIDDKTVVHARYDVDPTEEISLSDLTKRSVPEDQTEEIYYSIPIILGPENLEFKGTKQASIALEYFLSSNVPRNASSLRVKLKKADGNSLDVEEMDCTSLPDKNIIIVRTNHFSSFAVCLNPVE